MFAAVCDVEQCDPDDSLFNIGGDSVRAAEVAGVLEGAFGVPLNVTDVLEAGTPRAVAEQVVRGWTASGRTVRDLRDHVERLATEAEGEDG